MKIKIPFTPRVEDAYFSYLVSMHDYSVEDALRIIAYINKHPSEFVVSRVPKVINSIHLVLWIVRYRGEIILNSYLLKFIENDCLPF